MSIKEQTVAEMQRRVQMLSDELDEWQALTAGNVDRMGIHTSQIKTVTDFLIKDCVDLHKKLLKRLEDAPDDLKLASRRKQLEDELGGAHGLMMVFRSILDQRSGSYRQLLDAADLVAADCYRPCIARAVDWAVLEDGQYRVPPLSFLNARPSPQALTRERTFTAFGFDLEGREKALRLPFSFVSLRYHDTRSFWSYCSIHHEVGHLLDQDLGLVDALGEMLPEMPDIDPGRVGQWAQWLKELVADAFGVLLGGGGFALALADILFLPPSQVLQTPAGAEHPPPYLRIHLLGALLRRTFVPELETLAGEIEDGWQAIYGEEPPPAQAEYMGERDAMARLLVSEYLRERLDTHRLRDFAPHLQQDHSKAVALARHLRDDGPAPDPRDFPMRLAPAAARLALRDVDQQYDDAFADIHQRALDFSLSIPHDERMAPYKMAEEQETYLRELSRNLRFTGPEDDEEDENG